MTSWLLAFLLVSAQGSASALPQLALPSGDDAWVVRVVTSGGFDGRGAGNFTVSSAGAMFCTAVATCPDRLVPETQTSIAGLVAAIPASGREPARSSPLTPGTCSDCVNTTVTISRRLKGEEQVLTYTWDASTSSRVPIEVLRLQNVLLSFSSRRDR